LKEGWFLGDEGEVFAVVEDVDLADILAVAQDAAFVEIVEPNGVIKYINLVVTTDPRPP
jgi:hypothetical protein